MAALSKLLPHMILFLLSFSIILPVVVFYSWNKPFSMVFTLFHGEDSIKTWANTLNNQRLAKAKQYLATINETSLPEYIGEPELAVVIVTVNRTNQEYDKSGYILQTVAATHKMFVQDEIFPKKIMMICNVDVFPQNYTEVVKLKSSIPVIQRYGLSSLPITYDFERRFLYGTKIYPNNYYKETVDYMFCLETAHSLRPKYVLMIEDDSMPRSNALEIIHHKLQYLKRKSISTLQEEFAYIKLFYPPKWQGYGFELTRLSEIICIGCIGGSTLVAINLMTCKSRSNFIRDAYFLYGVWLFVLVVLTIGRQNVMEFFSSSKHFYTLRPSPGCCTPAMLFSSPFIPEVINFLESNYKDLHTDLALHTFIKQSGIPAYQIEPNLFNHIGMYTSLSSNTHKSAEEFIFDDS